MRKQVIGIILVVASLVALVGAVYWYNGMYSANWMNQMMGGGMMGGNTQHVAAPWYILLMPLLLFVPLVAGIVMVSYFAMYPEIHAGSLSASFSSVAGGTAPASFESVVKTMKPDEQRVLEILKAHNGVYLQKSLRTDSGLTRLKVHRIVARLAERGIVSVKESGNSNEVSLAEWLRN